MAHGDASGRRAVRTFELYIDDDRYSTPTLVLADVVDEERALELAKKKFAEDERHRGIEVCENGVRLFGLGTLAFPPRTLALNNPQPRL
jgi:hypothetical protein